MKSDALVSFLVGLATDPDRLARFRSDPEGAYRAAGLGPEERAAVEAGDPDRLLTHRAGAVDSDSDFPIYPPPIYPPPIYPPPIYGTGEALSTFRCSHAAEDKRQTAVDTPDVAKAESPRRKA